MSKTTKNLNRNTRREDRDLNWKPPYFTVTAIYTKLICQSGVGGLEVVCWPLVRKFAVSNPAEAVGFFRAKKSSACLPSEGK
jgi:hypothetical protein